MFLKRLETVGFKSFAERVQIDFVHGVTAVVGPNGSGKSNVIDAVRWVLGEQSAKSLRGQKMEDIIFQGSDSRSPLNFAEVAILLNNTHHELPIDYEEVNVMRRVYRSGESEFFINNQACRLKDIVDLFMDTGLGRESFSIIGQGKIDDILSSKAEERRAVFEEAAGVLKYKQRKKRAEFKLVETGDNLDRVEDIIHEIESQIEPLEHQAATAKQYQKKKQQLEQVEVALLVTEIETLHGKWQALSKELEDEKLSEIRERTNIQEKEAMIEKERQQIQVLDDEITVLQEKMLHVTEELEKCEGKRNVWKERSHHLDENKQQLTDKKIVEQEQIRHLRDEKIAEEKKLNLVRTVVKTDSDAIAKLHKKLYHGQEEMQSAIESLKSDYIEYLNTQAVLQNESKSIERELTQLLNQGERESSSYLAFVDKQQRLEQHKIKQKKELDASVAALEEKEAALKYVNEKLRVERQAYEIMQGKLHEGNEQIASLVSRKDMLVEMKESFQGFFYGVKEILRAKQKGILQGIDGTVLDLIKVPVHYTTAIDTVLGAQAQYVVVPDDEIARRTIQWLKKENKGRATFLPLKSISVREIPISVAQHLENAPGFIGIAANLVEVQDEYEKAIRHLLGNVIVTDTLVNANKLAKLTNRSFRVVTLDGDMVYPGGSMSGGTKRKQNQSLFNREKETQLLTDQIIDFKSRTANSEQKVLQKKQELIVLDTDLTQLEGQIQTAKINTSTQQKKWQDIMLQYRSAANEMANYSNRTKEQETIQKELEQKIRKNEKEQTVIKIKLQRLDEEIEELTKQEKAFQDNEKQSERNLHELEIKRSANREKQRNHERQLEAIVTQLTEREEACSETMTQLTSLMDETEVAKLEAGLEKEIGNFRKTRDEASRKLEQTRITRHALQQQAEDQEGEVKGLFRELERFAKSVQENEVQVNRLDVELENRLNALQQAYRMTYEKAAGKYDKVQDVQAAQEEVRVIKVGIERLGTVNLGAIEEYARLKERYEFLLDQQDDLVAAKKTLYDVIREMDEEMVARFNAVFTEIQSAFTAVFKKLFGGGHAELKLTEPDQLLETGIDIIARPPGKKLKTLGLLSGGERALTAIALLFAILRVRPVPFCILDEVDAALDEANVQRFGAYLQSYSAETQFIVITHRKGTMEDADALYGITMQESGVSRLVSVKLEETTELVESTT